MLQAQHLVNLSCHNQRPIVKKMTVPSKARAYFQQSVNLFCSSVCSQTGGVCTGRVWVPLLLSDCFVISSKIIPTGKGTKLYKSSFH